MKKNVLALSITAALVGLTGGAHAMTGPLGGASTVVQEFNGQGVGHSLIVPYFTTQDKNNTLINLVNTDLHNGKAVKVRFRGAANSDDIFDFQVFLSPGDVWTANISQGANGLSKLTTNDASCTKPSKAVLNSTPFISARLDQTMSAAGLAAGTREGYVEIFNMGDIPKVARGPIIAAGYPDAKTDITAGMSDLGTTNPLYTAIKHRSAVAPCDSADAPGTSESAAAWRFLDNNNLAYGPASKISPSSAGLLAPTTGLMANWTIINVVGAAAWSGEAVAVEARDAKGVVATSPTLGVVGERVNMGNVVYWPQTDALIDPAAPSITTSIVELYSADPIFRTANVYTAGTSGVATKAAAGAVRASYYDMPDMSTPYLITANTPTSPTDQARTLTDSIATRSIRNEFLTDPTISATTDWLFSLPTRRYSVAFDYNFVAVAATNDGRRFTDINLDPTLLVTAHFNQNSTVVSSDTNGNGRQICAKLGVGVLSPTDREETVSTAPGAGVVISPSPITNPARFDICGEAAVLSINNGPTPAGGTGALRAQVATRDADVKYRDGWATLVTPPAAGALIGLPVLGSSFSRAVGNSAGQTFGISSNHRFQR